MVNYRLISLALTLSPVRDVRYSSIDCIRSDLYIEAERGFCGLIWSTNGLLLGVKAATTASCIALAAKWSVLRYPSWTSSFSGYKPAHAD